MFIPQIDEHIATAQVIEALFPSDDLVQATRRVLNQISIADDEEKSMMLFEPWQVRINEKKVNKQGTVLWSTELTKPNGLCIGKGEIYVSDRHRICVLSSSDGTILRYLGKFGKGESEFSLPHDLALDEKDNLIVCDTLNHRIQIISNLNGSMLFKFGSLGDTKGCLSSPKGVVYDKKQALFVVSDSGNNRICIFDRFGHCLKSFKSRDDDSSNMKPIGICISHQLQELIVSDFGNFRILIFKNWKKRSHEMQQNLFYHSNNFNDISIVFRWNVEI
ncbi:hypothetical protein C9374_004552 [Naegleria lovaniensis]|uniref:Uncharacterized protein n=1 Tax=Naegleria lovaniensis TaxID=51637 RepID=A0AA88GMS4_NAELO|nr:uncharacterized protein C9374_004552 [Naegleria lovaniensis]KAG2383215.1 hypothetical protein C9374_004552 [Naegleria lovaniensis]